MNEQLSQHWVLLGTAQASSDIWGLRRISFPCGYYMPQGAFAEAGMPMQRPAPGEVWAMGGLALEIGEGGKDIPLEQAGCHVAGYRPWLCLFHDNLLDELKARQHTIMVWDQGVSIFYGLWRAACQALGPLVTVDVLAEREGEAVSLHAAAGTATGEPANAYEHDAAAVIHFMSQFMTLSAGDVYVMGPLVAQRIPSNVDRLTLGVLGSSYSVAVA
jgi:hypothetical protein